ncbi:DUF3267 domain-containing protein [Prosthecobacter sp.]|jgi:hypothetical protein|uniref:DUF3267 domain-containing protein n=1 Tax=Prosthecobacter sp. TaxID=1965333 RepID=UPI003784918B
MRFHFGPIPETPDFVPEPPWRAMKEPTPWLMQLLAVPVAVLSGVLIGALWFWLTPLKELSRAPLFGLWFLTAFVWLIPVHEAVHALVHPGRGLSDRTCIGLWLSRGLFYAHCHGPMSRNRFIAILIAPFVVLSVMPLIGCAIVGITHPLPVTGSIVNAFLACGDLLGVLLIVSQIPREATIQNQSWRTYWHTKSDHFAAKS